MPALREALDDSGKLMYKLILFIFFATFVFGCTPKVKMQHPISNYIHIPGVSFCDLPKHEGQLVAIRAVYSGVDEYWALNAQEKCKTPINVELDPGEGGPIPAKYRSLFDSAYSSYWNTYLVLEATGIYESSKLKGYGHLGLNKGRFTVKDYLNVRLVRK
jgi:hypothetical protein